MLEDNIRISYEEWNLQLNCTLKCLCFLYISIIIFPPKLLTFMKDIVYSNYLLEKFLWKDYNIRKHFLL